MSETQPELESRQDLTQTAINCYLSVILAAAECAAKTCPEIGAPYKNRWRRLPQRIGFDFSAQSLEASGRMFQADLERYAELARYYSSESLRLVEKLGQEADEFDAAAQGAAASAALLDELAESLENAADLDGGENGDLLHLQSQGLRKAARQLRARLLPSLDNIAATMRDCRRVLRKAEQETILDGATGFVNARGFRYELTARFEQSQYCCVMLIDCSAMLKNGDDCSEESFNAIVPEFAIRLGDQFRPWDCLARVASRRFAIIFEASSATARERSAQIVRTVNGLYHGGVVVACTATVLEASDTDSLLSLNAAIERSTATRQECVA